MAAEDAPASRTRPALRAPACAVLLVALGWLVFGVGRAGPERPDEADPGSEAALLERLRALGYVDWAEVSPEDAERSGIALDVPKRSFEGALFYHSRTRSSAHLLAPSGEPLHSWEGEHVPGGWHHVELAPGGDLLVIRRDGVLERLDPDSRVRWRRQLSAHHDLAVHPSGRVFVLTHEMTEVPFRERSISLVDDRILELSAEGELLSTLSLHALFGDQVPEARLEEIAARSAEAWLEEDRPLAGTVDVFHANTIEILDRDVPGLGAEGDLLICIRELDLVAVIPPDGERVVWQWGQGELDRPHQPTLLPSGRLLVFDNGASRGWSRIVEVDPLSREIVWEYRGSPPASFFSEKMGGVQGLPNGNVLVTESQRGRAFEVTREGEIVFEFWNPELRPSGSNRAAIHRLRKLAGEEVAPIVERQGTDP